MAGSGDPFAKPMAWWGTIQASVAAHDTTAELWSKISARSAELGLETPPGMFQAVNEIRSTAAQLRNASSNLAAAPGEYAITGDMLAFLPYGAGEGERAAPRIFDVRVGYEAVRGGQPETGFITLRYTGGLPATVGALREDAEMVANDLVEGYGASFTGTTTVEIGEL